MYWCKYTIPSCWNLSPSFFSSFYINNEVFPNTENYKESYNEFPGTHCPATSNFNISLICLMSLPRILKKKKKFKTFQIQMKALVTSLPTLLSIILSKNEPLPWICCLSSHACFYILQCLYVFLKIYIYVYECFNLL